MPRIVLATGSPARRKNQQALDAQIDPKQAAFASFRSDPSGDEKLVHLWPTERDIARRHIAAVVLPNQLAVAIEYLHLLHAVMRDVQIADRVEAHAVRLIIDLP